MHFLLKIYKENAVVSDSRIEEDFELLRDRNAPIASASRVHSERHGQIALIMYLYDRPHVENIETFLRFSSAELVLKSGCRPEQDWQNDDPTGDFLDIRIDQNGNGIVLRPKMSLFHLFCRETDDCITLASEISLILLADNYLRTQKLSRLFDYRYIYESIMREWAPRTDVDRTFALTVKRLLPHHAVRFRKFQLIDEVREYEIANPQLEKLYLENKGAFYERVLDEVEEYTKRLLEPVAGKEIQIQLTGGLDSRNSLAILLHHQPHLGLKIHPWINGKEDHPDVEIARRIAEEMSLPFTCIDPESTVDPKLPLFPGSIRDYQSSFRVGQGDRNSNNFSVKVKLNDVPTVWGTDNFKRQDHFNGTRLNRFLAREFVLRNQYLLLSLDIVNEAALVVGQNNQDYPGTEFSYYLLRRFEPKLLDIPYVGQYLPLYPVEPWKTEEESKFHPHKDQLAYVDLDFMRKNLPIIQGHSAWRKMLRRFWPRAAKKLGWILHSHRLAPRYYRKIGPDNGLDSNRKKRTAMDYASVSDLTPVELFLDWEIDAGQTTTLPRSII